MKFGISFPHKDIGADPVVIRDFVQTAEDLGFDKLTLVDHVLGTPEPHGDDPQWAARYTLENSFHEPMTLLAHIAAYTSKIRLVTANIILPQRQAALVAKQAAEVDILSGGRLILGVGLGWNAIEFQALDMSFEDRGQRIEEQVDVMRRLWTEPTVVYDGKWHKFEEAGLNPKPIQQPIPIWFGAVIDIAVKRAARIADGFLGFPNYDRGDPQAPRKLALFRETAAAHGRDPDSIPIDATVYAGDRGPDEWLSEAEYWLSVGANSLTFRTGESGLKTLDQHLDAMRRLMG